MSKMYEALQNPHYKKIWEKINWQIRHPEAKTLEEALDMEATKDECYILEYEGCCNPQMHAVLEEKRGDYPFYERFKILGRPITLEDILILLNGKFTHLKMEDGYYIFENTTYDYPNNNEYTGTIIRSTTIFKLKIRTEFEDQTHETWETMANLIN